MDWLEVTIKTVSPAIDLLAGRLTVLGYDSFIMDDTAEFETFLQENTQYWDYVDEQLAQRMKHISQIRLYVKNDAAAPEAIAQLKSDLALFRQQLPDVELGSLEVSLANIQEEDWETSWKQYYAPIPIGDRLLVVPQWLHPDNLERRIPILLDPGMIFGTGAHASTQMCMRALERTVRGGERVLDLGSGSGILSITALRLGASSACGVDIDPKAEDIARENAALNGLDDTVFTAVTGDVLSDRALMERLLPGGYDIVLANIVADVIVPLLSVVPGLLRQTGTFICSGILNTRLDDVLSALQAAGLTVTDQEEQNDWCCLAAQLK